MNQHRIHANGKCLTKLDGKPDHLDILFDGNRMLGRDFTGTLSGEPDEHFPESVHFRLKTFEPQQDGTCVARYARVNADDR